MSVNLSLVNDAGAMRHKTSYLHRDFSDIVRFLD